MNLLEKIGLGPKKKEAIPLLGDIKKKEQDTKSIKTNPYIRSLIFISFLVAIVLSLPRETFKQVTSYEEGQPWRENDLTAPFTFSKFKTEAEIESEKESIRNNSLPIYHIRQDVDLAISTTLDSLLNEIRPVVESYATWQTSKLVNPVIAANDSVQFRREFALASAVPISDNSWQVLLDSYSTVTLNNQSESRFVANLIVNRLGTIVNTLLNDGIIDQDKEQLSSTSITVRDLRASTERTLNIENVRDVQEASEYTQQRISRFFSEESEAELALELYSLAIQPNFNFNQQATDNRIDEQINNISDAKGAITEGQVIIRRGDLITAELVNTLQSLEEARSQNASDLERWLRFSGVVITIIVISIMFFFYVYLYRKNIFNDNGKFLMVYLLLAFVSIGISLIVKIDGVNAYIMPLAIAPIILTIIFDSRVGIVSTYCLGMIAAIIIGNNFEFMVATIAGCSLGVYSVRDIKNRSQFFFTTPGVVFVTYVIVIAGFSLAKYVSWGEFGFSVLMAAVSSLFIFFTYPIILLLEKLFKVTTDFTLLELGDANRPLLKELMTKAPGTFHHSLQVSNLSEAAASAIGANSLLCRVGAMYHDIGKMEKPEYFVENQSGNNEHEKLKPQMSALVIKAHVTEGVKLAEDHKLPNAIIDFIKTHHGTSVIKYFYEKAKEDRELKSEIMKEDFMYEGPLPFSKETGILLLADGIEAASRAMKDPTYNKLKNLVGKLVDERVAEGQLSHCPLTFRDLQIIKESFLTILAGTYHSRIEYPEDDSGQKAKELSNTSTSQHVEST